jgi:hypothetical protein
MSVTGCDRACRTAAAPAVESQIADWIETDRRATVAAMFARTTRALMPPPRGALTLSERIAGNDRLPLTIRRDARAIRVDIEAAADIFSRGVRGRRRPGERRRKGTLMFVMRKEAQK